MSALTPTQIAALPANSVDFTALLTPAQVTSATALGVDLNAWNTQLNSQCNQWNMDAFAQVHASLSSQAFTAYLANPGSRIQARLPL